MHLVQKEPWKLWLCFETVCINDTILQTFDWLGCLSSRDTEQSVTLKEENQV